MYTRRSPTEFGCRESDSRRALPIAFGPVSYSIPRELFFLNQHFVTKMSTTVDESPMLSHHLIVDKKLKNIHSNR